jgi:hypothetical protein
MVDISKFLTLAQASELLGIPVWKLRRAAKAGEFPTYSFFNTRKLVLLEELLAVIQAGKKGGVK